MPGTKGGRLVQPGNATELARELRALLVDPDERRRLGEEGRRRVCEGFRAEIMARRTLDAWQEILAHSAAGRTRTSGAGRST